MLCSGQRIRDFGRGVICLQGYGKSSMTPMDSKSKCHSWYIPFNLLGKIARHY